MSLSTEVVDELMAIIKIFGNDSKDTIYFDEPTKTLTWDDHNLANKVE